MSIQNWEEEFKEAEFHFVHHKLSDLKNNIITEEQFVEEILKSVANLISITRQETIKEIEKEFNKWFKNGTEPVEDWFNKSIKSNLTNLLK